MPEIITLSDQIYWSYANLARAHSALEMGCIKYKPIHHIIRSKLYNGLKKGKISIRSIYDDERLKIVFPQSCVYCGETKNLSLDHIISRSREGLDEADNLVWACRSCNSSKRNRDMLEWMFLKDRFPSILILRRYLKIVIVRCKKLNVLEEPLENEARFGLPFSIARLPTTFPPLETLVLWVVAK